MTTARMIGQRWLERQEPKWARLESLLARAPVSAVALKPGEIRELALLYREAANDLARAQSAPEFAPLAPYLNNLVQRAHGRVYEHPPASAEGVLRFFAVDFPRCFRRNAGLIALATLMFAIGSIIAMAVVHANPETEPYFIAPQVISQLDQGQLWTDAIQAAPKESSHLMTNNIQVAFNAFAYGTVFGVGTLLLMLHNGMFAFGGPLQVCLNHGVGARLLTFIVAHGAIELTTIFTAGGAGMVIGFALLFPGNLPRWTAVRHKATEAFILTMGCVPLLMLAGIIEGMISLNRGVTLQTRLIICAVSIVFLIVWLGFGGREKQKVDI